MKILKTDSAMVKTNTYTIEVNGQLVEPLKVVYIEHLDKNGQLVDCNLRNEIGFEITDAAIYGFDTVSELLDAVQLFVDENA